MTRRVSWINPYITDIYMLSEGTELPDGNKSADGGTLVIEHDDDLMLCMDSPLDARDFLKRALEQVERFIDQQELRA